jgi:hypothetical protein
MAVHQDQGGSVEDVRTWWEWRPRRLFIPAPSTVWDDWPFAIPDEFDDTGCPLIFEKEGAAERWLSDRCVRYGRRLAGLPEYVPNAKPAPNRQNRYRDADFTPMFPAPPVRTD